MTELTFTAGERATLDLRDSAGEVAIKDWDGATIRIASATAAAPFVLKEGDTFRIRLEGGGTISLPLGLPAEVVVPPAAQVKVMRAGGETAVRPAPDARSGEQTPAGAGEPRETPVDFTAFADMVSEQGRRIFAEVTRAVRSGGAGASDEVARRLEEAGERIDEHARRVAERVQQEVDRAMHTVEHADDYGRRAAERARRHAERQAERAQRHAARAAEAGARAGARAARGRWWFTERLDDWDTPGAEPAARAPARATPDERRAILQMLQEGKITAEQAARLLDALGG